MNCVEIIEEKMRSQPNKMALTSIDGMETSFSEIEKISINAQHLMHKYSLKSGDSILIAIPPSPELYGLVIASLGLGIRIVFVEPWLALEQINELINAIKPKIFFSSFIGKLWGLRSQGIRHIPHWLGCNELHSKQNVMKKLILENCTFDHHAFIVFSSGTTGKSKGIIRTHGYMIDIFKILSGYELGNFNRPDIAVFPNTALFHLASGRGAVMVPHKWNQVNLKKVVELGKKFKAETISMGPGFLNKLIDFKLLDQMDDIKRVILGGASSDCNQVRFLLDHLPQAKMLHIYGGSEAEPVSLIDLKKSLDVSESKGFSQLLCLGNKINEITVLTDENKILWVSGANVSQEYYGADELNKGIKYRDQNNILWHCMGDRIEIDGDQCLWYRGRQHQNEDDFLMEQKFYSIIGHSKFFIHRIEEKLLAVGELSNDDYRKIKMIDSKIDFIKSPMLRDPRHRARIDRKKMLKKCGY